MQNRQSPTPISTPTRFQRFKSIASSTIRYIARSRPTKMAIALIGGAGSASVVYDWLPMALTTLSATTAGAIVISSATTLGVVMSILTYRGYDASLAGMDKIDVIEEDVSKLTASKTTIEDISNNETHALELHQMELMYLLRKIEFLEKHLRFFDKYAQLTIDPSEKAKFLSALKEEEQKYSRDTKAEQVTINIGTTHQTLRALWEKYHEENPAKIPNLTSSLPLDSEIDDSEIFDGSTQLFSPHTQLPKVFRGDSRRSSRADVEGVELKQTNFSARQVSASDAPHSGRDQAEAAKISIVVASDTPRQATSQKRASPRSTISAMSLLRGSKYKGYMALSDSSETAASSHSASPV